MVIAMSRNPWAMVLGYLLVALALVVTWQLGAAGLPLGYLVSYALVLVMTAGYALACHDPRDWRALSRPLPVVEREWVQERLVALAARYRVHGARGLEREVRPARSELEAQGVRLVADGVDPQTLETSLRHTAELLRADESEPARLWATLGRGAVNGGVVLSLLQLSAALGRPAATAETLVLSAFPATVYGLLLGWFVCQPQVCRRRRAAATAAAVNELWIDGLRAIAAGVHPRRLEEQLTADRRSRRESRAA